MIANFSWRQKEHLFVVLEYVSAVLKSWCYIFSFFHFPYVTWKGSTVGIEFVFKRFDMVIIPLFFELSFSQSRIYFFRATGCCCTFVYHAFPSAINTEGKFCLNSTVTLESFLCFFLNNLCYALWLFVTCFGYSYSLL